MVLLQRLLQASKEPGLGWGWGQVWACWHNRGCSGDAFRSAAALPRPSKPQHSSLRCPPAPLPCGTAVAAAATVLFIRRRRVGGAGLPTIGPNNSAGGASKPFPTATAATISPSSSSAQGQSSELDSFVVHCPAQAAGRGAGVDSFVSMPAMGGLGSVPPRGYNLDSFVTQPSVAGLNSLPADTQ